MKNNKRTLFSLELPDLPKWAAAIILLPFILQRATSGMATDLNLPGWLRDAALKTNPIIFQAIIIELILLIPLCFIGFALSAKCRSDQVFCWIIAVLIILGEIWSILAFLGYI